MTNWYKRWQNFIQKNTKHVIIRPMSSRLERFFDNPQDKDITLEDYEEALHSLRTFSENDTTGIRTFDDLSPKALGVGNALAVIVISEGEVIPGRAIKLHEDPSQIALI